MRETGRVFACANPQSPSTQRFAFGTRLHTRRLRFTALLGFKSQLAATPMAHCYPCAKRDLAHFAFTRVPRQRFSVWFCRLDLCSTQLALLASSQTVSRIKTKKMSFWTSSLFWCAKRDLNPYVRDTRPSNVPVCQFQHSRSTGDIISYRTCNVNHLFGSFGKRF